MQPSTREPNCFYCQCPIELDERETAIVVKNKQLVDTLFHYDCANWWYFIKCLGSDFKISDLDYFDVPAHFYPKKRYSFAPVEKVEREYKLSIDKEEELADAEYEADKANAAKALEREERLIREYLEKRGAKRTSL